MILPRTNQQEHLNLLRVNPPQSDQKLHRQGGDPLPSLEETLDLVALSRTLAFVPTRPEDVFGSLRHIDPPVDIEGMNHAATPPEP